MDAKLNLRASVLMILSLIAIGLSFTSRDKSAIFPFAGGVLVFLSTAIIWSMRSTRKMAVEKTGQTYQLRTDLAAILGAVVCGPLGMWWGSISAPLSWFFYDWLDGIFRMGPPRSTMGGVGGFFTGAVGGALVASAMERLIHWYRHRRQSNIQGGRV